MKCIFCKQNSDNSKSIEHIIPESLGNKSHTLESGIVCDKCNRYFATKIEKPVLEQPYFKSLRHRNVILNKKNRLPPQRAFLSYAEKMNDIEIIDSHSSNLIASIESSELFDLMAAGEIESLYIPISFFPETENFYISRLIGKIALEALAERLKQVEDWNSDFISHEGLDELRQYVRYGNGKFWPYSVRRIYDEWSNLKGNCKDSKKLVQIIHEYDFLFIKDVYLHFVCIIMGIEYVINIGDRSLLEYEKWLRDNDDKSPLCDEIQDKKKTRKQQP